MVSGAALQKSPSSRGPGHRPFTAVTRVRISVGTPPFYCKLLVFSCGGVQKVSPEGLKLLPVLLQFRWHKIACLCWQFALDCCEGIARERHDEPPVRCWIARRSEVARISPHRASGKSASP